MGIPTTGNVVDSQAYILRDIAELYKDHIELVYPTECVRRMFHDFARNIVVEDFLSSDCDILWFLDSDITPPLHVLDLIALNNDKWQVAGAVYPVFMCPPGEEISSVILTCYKKNPITGALNIASVEKSGTAFVDGLATGCLFIKREVFSQLEKPYFEFKFNDKTRELTEGEDLGFCNKLSKLGIQFFTDFDLVCKHQKSIDLLDVNNYAINYSNNRILSYDKDIRANLKQAMEQSFSRGYQAGLNKDKPVEAKSSIWLP